MHSHFLLTLMYSLLLVLTISTNNCGGNESPGFFLKITKNVPRLGRRSDSYFLKNMKAVPRIGRSDNEANSALDLHSLSKRMLLSPAAAAVAAEREYSLVQPVTSNTLIEMLNKNEIATDNIKFIHWKDFDRALQMDTDLYGKLISLGRRPDQRLKEDLSVDITNGYTPQLPNTNKNNNDYMYYSKDFDNDIYSQNYGGDFLRYNQLK